jgi:ribonucleoside-triphosphate reductase (formate)
VNCLEEVKKRDGQIVPFDKTKITRAIFKAMRAVGEGGAETAQRLTEQILSELNENYTNKTPTVEEIQDLVEKILMHNHLEETAKAYILYRKQHADIREMKSLLSSSSLVEGYLDMTDWRVKENANMSYSLQGLNSHISSAVVSNYWLNKVYPKEVRNAHANGEFHLHDLGTLGPYCVGWDLRDLLVSGFGHVRGKISSKPAKHFRSALGHVVNFFYTLQGEAAGAEAFSNFDTYLAPFIRYDGLNYGQVKQALQEFVFNINVPTRVGFQTPFTNVTMDLTVPSFMKNDPVIINGKASSNTYGEFQEEMNMMNQAFAEIMADGDADGRVFTFPIPTYNITKDFDWEMPMLKSVFEMTAKYGIPYFSNFVNSDMSPEDARSMCCRLRLDNRELRKRGGGLFGANPLTGSVGVVTINLPRIGKTSNEESVYFEKLDALMDTAKDCLEAKRNILERWTENGLYPYSKYYLRDIKTRFNEYWKNHFATIGIIGMNESLINFLGSNILEPESRKFGLKVLDHMRERLGAYQLDTGNIYNLEATPGEGTSYRLAQIDKKAYPDIVVANESAYKKGAAPYYTNSSNLPVDYTNDIFEALELQDEFQSKYTGGTVLHGFIGEKLTDWKSVRELVKSISGNFKLPYFTLTPTFSICPKHGYLAGEHEYCPKCDEELGILVENKSQMQIL